MKLRSLCLAMLVCLPAVAQSQPLIDRVPDNAVIYVGWQGGDALGPAYQSSKLKTFVENSSIPQLFNETLPQLIEKNAKGEPTKAEDIKLATHFAKLIAHHPTAFFVAGFDGPPDQPPKSKMGLICDAGTDKDTLLALFTKIAADDNAKGVDLHRRAISDGNVIGFVVGYDDGEKVIAGPGGDGRKALGFAERYSAAKSHIEKDAALVVYCNVESMLAQIDASVKLQGDEQVYAAWTRGRDASGILGLKQFVYSAGFAGSDWASQTYIDAPAPRTGLLKLLEPAPLDAGLLGRVPSDAQSVTVGQFDFAALIATIRDITTAVNPEAGKKLQQGLGFISMSLGRNLERELLGPLGPQWAIYFAPSVGSDGPTGIVVVNKLDDAKLGKAAWGDLAFAISNTVPNVLRQRQGIVSTAKFDDQAVPGSSLFSLTIGNSPWTPCWVVKDSYLYLGANPAVVAKAALAADQPKFDGTSAFDDMLKSLDAKSYTSFSYSNLPATADAASKQFDAAWTMLLNPAEQQGIELPNALLPPIDKVKPLLTTAGSASWADDKGLYSKEKSPFPFAGTTYGYSQGDQTLTAVGAASLGAAIVLPSLNKSREVANRVKGASNLRQIAMASMLYGNDHQGDAPPDLGTLLEEDVTVDVFVSPSSKTDVPPAIRNGTQAEKAKWVIEHGDMVYVKPEGKLTAAAADRPLVYEKFGIHGRDGVNIAYCDGHVEFHAAKAAMDIIRDVTGAEPVKYENPAGTPVKAPK
jgi:prepilin-type processing-associated H-X9-DG protein